MPQGFVDSERFEPGEFPPVDPVTFATGSLTVFTGIVQPRQLFVFVSEFLKLLDDLVIPANFLVDDDQKGISGSTAPSMIPSISVSMV